MKQRNDFITDFTDYMTHLLPILANDEIERLALKALLMGHYELESTVAALHPDAFYHPKNRAVYDAVLRIVRRGERPDLMKVTEELQTPNMKKANVLPEEISGLFEFDSSEDLSYLIRRLEDLRQRRELQTLAQKLMTACQDIYGSDIQHENEVLSRQMQAVTEGSAHQFVTLSQTADSLVANLGTPVEGLPTGFSFIDSRGGLPLNGLTVIGAGTSQGKSAFALCVALEAARHGHRIAYLSLEMTTHDLTERVISMHTGIDCSRIHRNVIDDIYEQGLIADARDEICGGAADGSGSSVGDNIFFDDSRSTTLERIKQSIRFLNHRHRVNVAVVDYLQIMSVQLVRRNDTTEQLLAHAARELHNLAKDLGIAIIAISQLNRDREDSEPQLSRLRDSSQIADAADAVILLYRPERYGKSYTGQFRAYDTHNTALVKVAKMRQGATGDFICGFSPQQTRFFNLDRPPVFDVNPSDVFGSI